jgi:hypothetical protein
LTNLIFGLDQYSHIGIFWPKLAPILMCFIVSPHTLLCIELNVSALAATKTQIKEDE